MRIFNDHDGIIHDDTQPEQQGKQYDLLSRSLENQNKLLQSRASLATALNGYIQGEYKILQDSAGSESERKRLIKEAADAQLVAMQQQQVVAQKNLDIEIKQAEIAQKRAEFEAEIAEIKARAGSAKAGGTTKAGGSRVGSAGSRAKSGSSTSSRPKGRKTS